MEKRIQKYQGEIIESTKNKAHELSYGRIDSSVVIKFRDLRNASQYCRQLDTKDLHYKNGEYETTELSGRQLEAYLSIQYIKERFISPVSIILTIVATLFLPLQCRIS